jgi:hypothetical protein
VYSADGARVLTGSADETARLWSPPGGTELVRLRFDAPVDSVQMGGPDGVALVESNGLVSVYGCEVTCALDDVVALAHRRVTRELTPDERRQFMHEP